MMIFKRCELSKLLFKVLLNGSLSGWPCGRAIDYVLKSLSQISFEFRFHTKAYYKEQLKLSLLLL